MIDQSLGHHACHLDHPKLICATEIPFIYFILLFFFFFLNFNTYCFSCGLVKCCFEKGSRLNMLKVESHFLFDIAVINSYIFLVHSQMLILKTIY